MNFFAGIGYPLSGGSYTGEEMQIMATLKNLAHRLMSKVVSILISFAFNPHQAEIFQLLWDIYDICSFMIQ